jgi:hypothetical protein
MAIAPARDESFAVQPHETGIAEKLDSDIFQRIIESRIELLARGEGLVIDGEGGDESGFGPEEALRARDVGDHEDDFRRIVWDFARFDQSPKV